MPRDRQKFELACPKPSEKLLIRIRINTSARFLNGNAPLPRPDGGELLGQSLGEWALLEEKRFPWCRDQILAYDMNSCFVSC